jgi:hypothetical protein
MLIPAVVAIGTVVLIGRAAAVRRELARTIAVTAAAAGDIRRARDHLEAERLRVGAHGAGNRVPAEAGP